METDQRPAIYPEHHFEIEGVIIRQWPSTPTYWAVFADGSQPGCITVDANNQPYFHSYYQFESLNAEQKLVVGRAVNHVLDWIALTKRLKS